MLTGDLAILRFEGEHAVPDRLVRGRHGHYVDLALSMLDIYRTGVGKTRAQLHHAVEALFLDEPDCEIRRVHAFCKLLDDVSTYQTDARDAAALRLKVFTHAAKLQPLTTQQESLVGTSRAQVTQALAQELGRPWAEIEDALYADVMAFHKLEEFAGFPDGKALLSRYNVAQTQAALYRAQDAVVDAGTDFKNILRAVRLARLMHDIQRVGHRYRISLSGPASVLRTTVRYGIHLARVLPALLQCWDWTLTATLQTPWKTRTRLTVTSEDGLSTHLPALEPYDSQLEERFAERFGDGRDGWMLHHEPAILHHGQTTFVPDFALRHEDGTEVLLEIVGFWTPEYLEQKRATLRLFPHARLMLAIPETSLKDGVTADALEARDDVVVYKTALKPDAVIEHAQRMRAAR